MENDLWINKYRPTQISQIVGNKIQIDQFKNWLNNINISKKLTIIISGYQGMKSKIIDYMTTLMIIIILQTPFILKYHLIRIILIK